MGDFTTFSFFLSDTGLLTAIAFLDAEKLWNMLSSLMPFEPLDWVGYGVEWRGVEWSGVENGVRGEGEGWRGWKHKINRSNRSKRRMKV